MQVRTVLTDERSLSYRQTFADRDCRWRLTASYVADPAHATVLVDVRFTALEGHELYAVYDPSLSNTRTDDTGRSAGDALVASDASSASAFAGSPAFRATSSGFRGTSDGWTDLLADGRLDWTYTSADAGNLVQTAATGLTGRSGHDRSTLALGFGADAAAAQAAMGASLQRGFGPVANEYAGGWHAYLEDLADLPSSLSGQQQRTLYQVSAMVLAASEDKTHRGAYVAAPTMPWIWGKDDPSGPYHLVWSRDLYQIGTALIATGDTAGANRALDYLLRVQQKPDGSFPQNSRVDGTPVWGGLQLDEVALPIVLAHQLGRTDAETWRHVKLAADFLLGFEQDGNRAPWTPQDRWENQSGYHRRRSPARSPDWYARPTSPGPTATPPRLPATSPPPTTGRPGSRAGRSRRPGRTRPDRTSCA